MEMRRPRCWLSPFWRSGKSYAFGWRDFQNGTELQVICHDTGAPVRRLCKGQLQANRIG
ncbi:hypothetical protein GCM10007285_39890 [Stappia taiwanensis]|nr:hypothetical protein GCM10007285_39890 [Stappia taiwanensis]